MKNVTIIASGGLSGGLSSSIAGGNFWDGVRQGLITSGLNHGMNHSIMEYQKHAFEKQIDAAFGNKADKPVLNKSTDEVHQVINKVPKLKSLHNKFIKRFSSMKIEYDGNYKGFDLGLTKFNNDDQTVDYVYLYNSSFSSYRTLSHVILHEFGHVNSAYHGFYFKNVSKYGQYSDTPKWIDEIYAHKFANYHGGSPLNTEYYKRNVDRLKGTTWKINAENLILPTFD